MKRIVACFISVFFGVGVFAQMPIEKNFSKAYLCITIPRPRSQLAGDKYYKVLNDSLYVFLQEYNYRSYYAKKQDLHTIKAPKLLESYPIEKDDLLALESLFEKTNSFGNHGIGITHRERPEFLIEGKYKGKKMNGYTIDCYREHIFVFVDWLNNVYPGDDIINYDKQELISREQAIKLYHEKSFKEIKSKNKRKTVE